MVAVRHGETEWSRSGQHTGTTDIDLTAAGEEQARHLGARLAGAKPDLVLVSPLRRAWRTAELAGLVPYEVVDDLREWDYGEMEGRTTADIQRRLPGWTIWDGPWPGGERPEEVAARADRVIARVLAAAPARQVAVVAHGHLLRVLAARWLGAQPQAGRWLALGTAALCQLGWEHEAPVIQHWNLSVSD